MIWIAHRGNIHGLNPEKENHPDYLKAALKEGWEVECDVWNMYGKLFLGHEYPQYEIDEEFLKQDRIWVHCKNVAALECLHKKRRVHSFWHEDDAYTLTSWGFIWVYPGNHVPSSGIMVLPEWSDESLLPYRCRGMCSDYIELCATIPRLLCG